MSNNFHRVQILNQSLSSIQLLAGSTIVIKYGGAAMSSYDLKKKVIEDILFLSYIGLRIILVHGGGPVINYWLNKINIEPRFKNGVRLTDYQTMEIVEMVLSGKVNKEIVGLINQKKSCAIGLSGKDANFVIASKLNSLDNDYVGTVKCVNIELINLFLDNGYIPVISSVASDEMGYTYNINADVMAGSLAQSLKADKLVLLTDTPGIMLDVNSSATLLRNLNIIDISRLKNNNVISGGMIPKVDCCVDALKNHVKSAHIIDGRVPHSLLLELFTVDRIGSMLTL